MKTILILSVVSGAVLAADTAHDISGRVVDAQTGRPIVRASVAVGLDKRAEPHVVLTGEDGVFHVLNLPNGRVRLSAESQGYLGSWALQEGERTIEVGASPELPFLTLRLVRQSAIHGVVIGENNTPVRNADVTLVDPQGENFQRVGPARANEMGAFRISELKAGWYSVAAVDREGCAPKTMAYPKTYLGDVTDLSEAEWIELDPGRDAEIRIHMKALRGIEVSGRVVPTAPGTSIQIIPTGRIHIPTPSQWDEVGQKFRFYRLPPGTYILSATADSDGKQLSATQTIVIRDADINGIVLELREEHK
jgi:hypothetical protein